MRRLVCLVFALVTFGGCTTLGYYGQAMGGHLAVLGRARPIDELLADPTLAPELRSRLERVLAIRNFASQALRLPDNDSYRRYADLGRPFAVWNVFAAPELSLQAKEWCFLFAGCVAYRGYFSLPAAQQQAEQLQREGYDVHVGGAIAYSTLGWFNDPLLNTMFGRPEPELAGLLFHELAHQKLYVPDDTAFNESFAMTVEREGVRRWLVSQRIGTDYVAYLESARRQEEFTALVLRYRERLETLYRSAHSDDDKRRRKQELFSDLKLEYVQVQQRWGGYSGYDRWMENLNNAKFVSVGLYHDYVSAFEVLLAQQHGDLSAFYAAARKLAQQPRAVRAAALAALMPGSIAPCVGTQQ